MNISITHNGKVNYKVNMPNNLFSRFFSKLSSSEKMEIITENGLTLQEEEKILLSEKKLSKAMSKDDFLEHLETL